MAYLEKLRSDKLRMACVHIQKTIRCWLARKKYLRMRESAITLQRHVRGHQARWYVDIKQQQNRVVKGNRNPLNVFFSASYVKLLRRTRAAVVIQRSVRMWATRRRYQQQRSAAITIQCFLRAHMARKKFYKVMSRFPLLETGLLL